MTYSRVDKNQKEIVEALRKVGCIVKHVHTIKNLFDILVYYNGITYNVEIKQDKTKKLTPGELKCKKEIESVGVKYYVIYSIEDALNMIRFKYIKIN